MACAADACGKRILANHPMVLLPLPRHKPTVRGNTHHKGDSMRDASPQTIYLKDYTPFGYNVDEVHLTFDLAPSATRVMSRIKFSPNPDATDKTFFLHGKACRSFRPKLMAS